MKCKACGTEVLDGQLFCPNCGTKIEPINEINMIPTRVQPNPMPTNPMPTNPMPSNPIPPSQMSPNQAPPYQGAPYPTMPNQIPPAQSQQASYGYVPPNQPPIPPTGSYQYNNGKPKNKALVPIIIGAVAFFLVIMIVVIVIGINLANRYKNEVQDAVESIYEDETAVTDSEDTFDGKKDEILDDTAEDYTEDNAEDDTEEAEIEYDMVYSYYELPDVVSIDTDPRFTYYDYYYDTELVTYTFLYTEEGATEDDFYTAVEDYCSLLMNWNGFYYEEDFSLEQYETEGVYTDYFSYEDVAIGVTSSVEATGWYAYIDIYFLNETEESAYPNYSYYIDGRDSQYFEFGNEVIMENGVAFYLNEANIYDMGDGTAELECTMDLAATYEETYLYIDDFMVVPMDSEGNVLSDACLIEYVVDETGNYVAEPYLLDAEYYYSYTVTFVVPAETASLTFYGNNFYDGYASGPVYYFDMEVIE